MSSATDKPARAWLRFSIRAMMLLVLVVGLWLGWQVNNARNQQAAVAAVKRSGGRKLMSGNKTSRPKLARSKSRPGVIQLVPPAQPATVGGAKIR